MVETNLPSAWCLWPCLCVYVCLYLQPGVCDLACVCMCVFTFSLVCVVLPVVSLPSAWCVWSCLCVYVCLYLQPGVCGLACVCMCVFTFSLVWFELLHQFLVHLHHSISLLFITELQHKPPADWLSSRLVSLYQHQVLNQHTHNIVDQYTPLAHRHIVDKYRPLAHRPHTHTVDKYRPPAHRPHTHIVDKYRPPAHRPQTHIHGTQVEASSTQTTHTHGKQVQAFSRDHTHIRTYAYLSYLSIYLSIAHGRQVQDSGRQWTKHS